MTTLGIDTSNYTTSAALYKGGGEYDMRRRILDVKSGSRGIRQSDAVFIHNRELPGMLEELMADRNAGITAVGVSKRPRSAEGSYMPVFTVGHGYARAAAAAAGVPLYEFSHQDGHIMAGILSGGCTELLGEPFLSVHISGGTTEILRTEYNGYNFDCTIIGGTLDISAGQLIDRVGVAMGLKFPCGAELERLAESADKAYKLPFSVKGSYVNLSGAETKLLRMISGADPDIARTAVCYIRDVLALMIGNAVLETGLKKVLIAGGVASNSVIRSGIIERVDAEVHFASRELSTDNAVGVACLAYMAADRI